MGVETTREGGTRGRCDRECRAVQVLREKFQTVDDYGPRQLTIFHDSPDPEEGAMHARRAYELVQKLLSLV